jgi:bifunctional non-homologous end joining protein LigD
MPFDLLWLDGWDLRRRPLLERKAMLEKLLARLPGRVVCSDHLPGDDGERPTFGGRFVRGCES